MSVSEKLETKEVSVQTDRFRHLRRLSILGGLGVMAYVSKGLDSSHYESVTEAVSNSLAHPVLGYAGALVATGIGYVMGRKRINDALIFTGATVANVATEFGQDFQSHKDSFRDGFLSNSQIHLETPKDYAFALLGMGLFMVTEKRLRKQPQSR